MRCSQAAPIPFNDALNVGAIYQTSGCSPAPCYGKGWQQFSGLCHQYSNAGKNNTAKVFTTRSELERWRQGIPPGSSLNLQDPVQFADPLQQGAAEGFILAQHAVPVQLEWTILVDPVDAGFPMATPRVKTGRMDSVQTTMISES